MPAPSSPKTGFSVTSSVYQTIIRQLTDNQTSREKGRMGPFQVER
jgi:hypothetical protein